MSDFTLKEANAYYRRKLNTYQYSVLSKNCAPQDKVHTFSIDIPPFPYPTKQQSCLAIFRLKKYFVLGQGFTDASRVSGDTDADLSGFVISVGGLGLRGSQFTNSKQSKLTPNNEIIVINKYGEITPAATKREHQVVSGSDEEMTEIVISNPSGTHMIFEVRSIDNNQKLPEGDGSYYSFINFEIELLAPDISMGDV